MYEYGLNTPKDAGIPFIFTTHFVVANFQFSSVSPARHSEVVANYLLAFVAVVAHFGMRLFEQFDVFEAP